MLVFLRNGFDGHSFTLPFCDHYGSLQSDDRAGMDGGFLTTCTVRGRGKEGVKNPPLSFAYETLIFYSDLEDQFPYSRWLQMWFEDLSEVKINLEKSGL